RSILYAQVALGTIIARVIVAYLFIKPYYRYNVYSVYELLEKRFGRATRFAGSLAFLITRILASGIRLYIGSVVLVIAYKFLSGTNPGFRHYIIAIILMAVITTIYTAIGGIKAVIWTDVIQASMMFGGAVFALLAILYLMPHGWEGLRAGTEGFKDFKAYDWGLQGVTSFSQALKSIFGKEYTLWTALIGYVFLVMATHGTDQDLVQRMLTAPDIRQSRRSLILSGIAELPISLVFVTIGILLYAFYKLNVDPGLPKADNEVFAYFIVTRLPVVARGLIIAAIFATAMGSYSSALNALATSFVRGFYGSYIRPSSSDDEYVKAARVSTAVFSVLMILVAAVAAYQVLKNPNTTIIPVALTIFGYTYGPLLGVFLVGLLTKTRGNDKVNVIAMVAGILGVLIISGTANSVIGFLNHGLSLHIPVVNVPTIAFTWYVMIGCLITFAIAVCGSTGKNVAGDAISDWSILLLYPEGILFFGKLC